MNTTFFRNHLQEELEGAKEFATYANKIKAENPKWGRMLMDVSESKEKTAKCLMKMMEEYGVEAKSKNDPTFNKDDYDHTYQELMDKYSMTEPQVRSMREMYAKRY